MIFGRLLFYLSKEYSCFVMFIGQQYMKIYKISFGKSSSAKGNFLFVYD